jgi:tyrosyl-tRNA synthetase
MSKSLGNYIGVSEPPEEIYGKTLSLPDSALAGWYRLLLGGEPPAGLGPRDAKRALARALADRFAGAGAGAQAEEAFDRVFVRGDRPAEVPDVSFAAGNGSVHLPALLASAFGISTSEARRALAQGAIRLDGEPVAAGELDLPRDRLDGRIIQFGKRRFARVRLSAER